MIEPKRLTEINRIQGLSKFSLIAVFLLVSSTLFATDYYWVGNSGNWNDNSHWALSSGGNGGAGIPTANDDVYFDANSFTVNSLVQINNSAVCKDFIWEGTFGKQGISGSGDLNVYGSLVVQDELNNEYNGNVNLLAQSGSKIIKAGQLQWNSDFRINGGATFTMEDALATSKTKTIIFEEGTLSTNGNLLYTGVFKTESNAQKNILLGSSTLRIFEEWNVENGSNISLNANAAVLELLETIPQNQIKKGSFQYGTISNKAACGNGIDFSVAVTSNYNGAVVSCTGDCDGEITVTINGGGGGPYGYEGTSGLLLQSSNVFTGVCATTYNITVYDSSQLIVPGVYESCTEFGVVLADPSPIGINVQGFTEPTCPGDCDGSIFTSIGGGTGALDIQWPSISPFPFIGEDPIGIVCAGDHDVTVTDFNGCTFTTTVTLTDPPAVVPSLVVTPVSCNNVCDGEIEASATGGNGNPYTYTWDAGGSPPNDSLNTGLCELTTYTVTIEDALGCTTTASETVPDRDSITITAINPVNPTCFGVCNGEMSLGISGGSGSYIAIDWAVGTLGSGGVPFVPTGLLNTTNLCAGVSYIVYVTDDNGCQDSLQLPMLTQPSEIITTVTDSSDLLCAGDANGFVDITTVGGTPINPAPAYTYEWTVLVAGGGEITADEDQFTLIGGDYQVVATDDLGCTDTVTISVFEPDSIFANGTFTDNLCWDDLSASIDLTTTGGTGPGVYTWTWVSTDGGFVDPGTEDLMNLDSGSYTVTIVDTNMCSYDTTFLITTPGEIYVNAAVINATCSGASTGSIDITPVNGVGVYVFDWDNIPPGGYVDPEDQGGLPQGAYNVSIMDDNGCVVDSTINISDPTAISGVLTPTNSSCGAANGSITAVISGGSGDFTYEWFDGGGNPVGGNSPTVTGPADCYDLVYTDIVGCVYTDQECIVDDAAPTGTFVTQDLNCFQSCDGAIDATISGGALPYASISWTSTVPGYVDPGTEDIFALCAGDYTITVTDANGCIFSQTLTITEPAQMMAGNSVVTAVQCFGDIDGAIDITVTGGTVAGAYGYSWTGPGYTSAVEDISPLAPGTYCVHVTDDNACFLDTCMDINEPLEVTATYTSNNAQCGVPDGDATIVASGGTTPPGYFYDWYTIGGTLVTESFLGAGVYPVEVTDANGCADTVQVTISEDNGPIIVVDDSSLVSCNGICDGFIQTTVTGANPFTLSWTSAPAGYSNNVDDISLLCAATYVLTATDDVTGCQASVSIDITEPAVFDIPGAVIEPTCFGGTGTIDITPTGGTLPYTFDWDNDGTGDFDDLEDITDVDGTYIVDGLDASGCAATGTFTITEPTEITTLTSSVPSTDCITPDGSVTVVAIGGTPGPIPNEYTYLWTDASTGLGVGNTATVPGLMQGCYNVDVSDANGCTVSASECFNSAVTPPLTFTQTDVTCFGDLDGTISITSVTSGDSLFYTGGPVAIANNTINPTGLPAGQYTVEDTDNGCTSSAVIDILEPIEITLTETLTNPFCAGAATGSISLVINDAIGITGIVWTGGTTAIADDTNPALNLEAGTYTATITDVNGCTAVGTYQLNDNPTLTITTSNVPTSCIVNDGSVTVVPAGGVVAGNYQIDWDIDGVGDNDDNTTEPGLGAGTYTVIVTDDLGCTATASETLSNLNGPTVTLVSQSDVTCFGDNDGEVFVNVSGGTLPYGFLWNMGDITQNLTGQGPGYDTLTVTDGAGCIGVLSDSILEPTLLTVSGVETDVNCFGDGSGAVDITVAGGTTPYASYLWTDQVPQTISINEDVNGLSGGTYDVIVTDANGCTANYSGVVNEPTEIVLTTGLLNSSCATSDGSVSVAAIGGSGTYTYDWEDVLNPGFSLGTNDTLFNQPAGSYEVVVDDGVCMDSITVAISDATGPAVTSAVTNVICDGDGNGAIDLTVTEIGLTYVWTGPVPFVDPGTEDLTGLDGGTYSVLVTNALGCSTSEVIIVGGPTGPLATTEIISDLTCFDDASGAIDVTTTGGTPSLISGYTFSWIGPNGFTSTFEDISLLDSGAYDLIVTDSNMCNYSVTYNVTQPDSIALNALVVDATCGLADGSITTAVTGGDGNYTYAWTETISGSALVPGNNPSELALGAGVYEIIVTDGAGCSTTESIPVSDANAATLTFAVVDVTCNGADNGEIDMTVNGPNTYNYTWSGPVPFPGAITEDLVNGDLVPGTYSVLVEDQVLGCFSAATVDVLEPTVLSITGLDTSLVCFASMDGSIDITVIGGTPIVPAPDYTYSWTSSNGSFVPVTTEDLIGLDTGIYMVTATDLNGCTIATQFTISQPGSMELTSVVTNDICSQGGNASIDITVTQGTTPYTYNWSWTGNTSNNEDLTNLFADTYTLSIVDSNSCQKDTTFIITEASQIIADVTVVDANCTLSDGSATSNTSGGAGGYSWSWSSGTNAILAQPSGVYPLTIIDMDGCQLDTTVTINDVGGPTITIDNINDVTCFGSNDGGVDVTVSGGSGVYVAYLWNPNAISQVEDLANAPADDYTFQVTDDLGCSSFEVATINEPTEISATYTTVVATCGICNGEATVTATGGSGSYSYIWSDNQTTQTATGLCAGVQTVQITDFNNCVSNVDVAVSSDAPGTETMLTTNVTCFGGNDGTAEAVPVGGSSPYTYFWPHNGSVANPITNLSAGTYFVEVSDANGCVHVVEAIISESTVITSTPLITPATCGGNDGAITTTTAGGSGAYTYVWSTADLTQDITLQPEGVYSLTIGDGACSITEIYTIPGIGAPEVSLSTVETNCYNDNTGSIFSTVTNNVGVVTYEWFNGVTSMGPPAAGLASIVNSLAPGTYSVEVFDPGTGCSAYATGIVTAPDSIVLSIPTIIDATCGGICDGEAYIVASGGTLPYTYSWTGNASDSASATALCAGPDTVTIMDAKFCTISAEVTVNEPFAITVITDSITDAFCVNTTDGAIYITANGGDANYTYAWTSIPAGFTDTTPDITGLLPMDYDLLITDGNGCTYTDTIPVDTLNVLISDAGLDSSVCAGSCIDLIGTAIGTSTYTLEWFDIAGTSVATSDTFQLCPTTAILESYVLVATDLSCTFSDTVDVLVNPLPIVDAGSDYEEIYGTTITLGGTPTSTNGTYLWTPTTNFTDTSGVDANPELSVVDNLEYVVTVTDTNGCVNSDTAVVAIFPEILFPNGFSPNGDGINDTWQIDLMTEFPESVVEVYNRWGQQLFISIGYVQEFDGTYKGEDLPVGTYYYIIVLNHPEYPDAYTGPITIMR